MHIEVGPTTARLLQAQARAAGLELSDWVEQLADQYEDAPAGAQVMDAATATRRSEVRDAIFDVLDGMPAEGRVYVMTIKRLLADTNSATTTHLRNFFDRLGLERQIDENGTHYRVGAIRAAVRPDESPHLDVEEPVNWLARIGSAVSEMPSAQLVYCADLIDLIGWEVDEVTRKRQTTLGKYLHAELGLLKKRTRRGHGVRVGDLRAAIDSNAE